MRKTIKRQNKRAKAVTKNAKRQGDKTKCDSLHSEPHFNRTYIEMKKLFACKVSTKSETRK